MRTLCVALWLFGVFMLVLLPTAFAESVLQRAPSTSAQPLAPSNILTYPGAPPCHTTLQACISAANNGDIVHVLANTYITNQLILTRAIELAGDGASSTRIGALGAQRVISIAANITAGVSISGMRVFSGNLNIGAEGGAGIFAGAGTPLSVQNVEVMSNTLGAALARNGAGILVNAPITLVNVSFANNRALDGAGGGLRALSSVNFIGGRVERNVALNTGGGIRADGALTLTNVTVISNSVTSASNDGGGIAALGGLYLQGSLVRNNVAADAGGGIRATDAVVSASNIISNAAIRGGGIFLTGRLIVSNTNFDNNKALAGDGGSIYASGPMTLSGSSTVSKTIVSNSTAMTNGGGIYAASSLFLLGELQFNANSAQHGEGGALYVASSIDDNFPISSAKLWSNNSSAGNGGAIRALGSIDMCFAPKFTNNVAGGGTSADGGAIYADGSVFMCGGPSSGNAARNGGLVYAKGQITFNTHDTLNNTAAVNGGCGYSELRVLYNSADARGCVAGQFGGAAYSPMTVTLGCLGGCIELLNQNHAGVAGGAAFANVVEVFAAELVSNTAQAGGAVAAATTLDIREATFISNTAGSQGGAGSVNGTAWVTNSLFTANRVTNTTASGGALFARGGALITNSTFISNGKPATSQSGGAIAGGNITTTQSSFLGNIAKFGGAISATSALVAGSIFTANGEAQNGGGIIATNVTVLDSRFIGNTTQSCCNLSGGAIYADIGAILNSYFEGNLAADEGAAVYISRTVGITASQFVRNFDVFRQTSAVYVKNANGGTSSIAGSLFDGNVANDGIDGGGAIEAAGGTLTVSSSQFDRNQSEHGGAIYMPAGSLYVLTSTFFNNLAPCCGGGGALNAHTASIQSSTFISNYADCCDGGGAVFGELVIIQTSQFYSNSVEGRMDGGAINAQSGLSVDSSTFENNSVVIDLANIGNPSFNSGRGGALYGGYNAGVDVTNSTFRRNRANYGGALACDNHCSVQTSLFENNVADHFDSFTATSDGTGGAINTTSDLEVYRSRFLRNRAGTGGGAVYENRINLQNVKDAIIQNSLFAENIARNPVLGSHGDAIFITGTVSSGKLYYNTIVSDSLASGSAVAILSGTVSVVDNIFTNHAVALEHGAGGTVFENFNLYFGNTTPISGTVTSGGTTITSDPQFIAPAADNYQLGLGSPAIDAGTDVLVSVDVDGDARPFGAGFDIGFDERTGAAFGLYLPLVVR